MLDVSEVESGQMELNLAASDLGALAREVDLPAGGFPGQDRSHSRCPSRRFSSGATPSCCRGWSRISYGTLSNSSLSQQGKVDIGLKSEAGRVRFTVRDKSTASPRAPGEGLRTRNFWQATRPGCKVTSTPSSLPGTALQNGRRGAPSGPIGVESEVGAGAPFWFELPQDGPGTSSMNAASQNTVILCVALLLALAAPASGEQAGMASQQLDAPGAHDEELQSTNEELTTSREEMQSLNEELQTVNAEQQAQLDKFRAAEQRHEEPARQHGDRHVLPGRRSRATLRHGANKIFKLIPGDVGRPLTNTAPSRT